MERLDGLGEVLPEPYLLDAVDGIWTPDNDVVSGPGPLPRTSKLEGIFVTSRTTWVADVLSSPPKNQDVLVAVVDTSQQIG